MIAAVEFVVYWIRFYKPTFWSWNEISARTLERQNEQYFTITLGHLPALVQFCWTIRTSQSGAKYFVSAGEPSISARTADCSDSRLAGLDVHAHTWLIHSYQCAGNFHLFAKFNAISTDWPFDAEVSLKGSCALEFCSSEWGAMCVCVCKLSHAVLMDNSYYQAGGSGTFGLAWSNDPSVTHLLLISWTVDFSFC